MITSGRRDELVPFSDTSRRYHQRGVTKIVARSGSPAQDQ
jgi:hypothetical protein